MLRTNSKTHYELLAYQGSSEKVFTCKNIAQARQIARKLASKGMCEIRIIKESFNDANKAWDFMDGKFVRYE